MKVVWIFESGEEEESTVESWSELLTTIKKVDCLTFEGEERELESTELVIGEEPHLVIALK